MLLGQLIEQFNAGKVVVLVGDALEDGTPSGIQLAADLVDACESPCKRCRAQGRCQMPEDCVVPLASAAQSYERRFNRHALITRAQLHFSQVRGPGPVHRAIAALPVGILITTACDDRLLHALREAKRDVQHIVTDKDIPYGAPERVQLIRLHGTISQPQSLVLTEEAAVGLFVDRPRIRELVQGHLGARSPLYLGYRQFERTLGAIHHEVSRSIGDHGPMGFALRWPRDAFAEEGWPANMNFLEQPPIDLLKQVSDRSRQRTQRSPRAGSRPAKPYKFLDYFERDDADIFHGRDPEATRLIQLILGHRLTVLYGESGTGKTSLVKARVLPHFAEQEGWVVAYARPLSDPMRTVQQEIARVLELPLPGPQDATDLAALIENGGQHDRWLIVVLDQFEELFIRQGTETRKHFVGELLALLDAPKVRCLLSLRSEYLGHLDELERSFERDPLQHRLRLHPLGSAQAREAIARPASLFRLRLEAGLLERVLDDLTQAGIAPPHLQIVCHVLWEDWVADGKPQDGLTLQRYAKLGGTKDILANYLIRVIGDLEKPEIRERLRSGLDGDSAQNAARALLKSMLTSERTKVALSMREITQREFVARTGLAPDQVQALLEYLRDRRVIRHLSDVDRYELAHEVMIESVWAWFSQQELHVLDLQDRLARAASDYRNHDWIMPVDWLEEITRYEADLALDEKALEMLLVSALEHRHSIDLWAGRMDLDRVVNILARRLEKGPRRNYPRIASALGWTESLGAVQPLESLLRDPDHEVLRAAAGALAQVGLPEAAHVLYHAAQREGDARGLPRAARIVEALGALRSEAAAAFLLLLSHKHKDARVRSLARGARLRKAERESLRMLAQHVGYHEAMDLIERELQSEDLDLRQRAADALERALGEDPGELAASLHGVAPERVLSAFLDLKKTGSKKAAAFLQQALRGEQTPQELEDDDAPAPPAGPIGETPSAPADPDLDERRRAVAELVKRADAGSVEALLAALSDRDSVIRRFAAGALGKLEDARAVGPLLAALSDQSHRVRSCAAGALGKLGDLHAVGPLLVALSDPSHEVQSCAAGALGKLGSQGATELYHEVGPLTSRLRKRAMSGLRERAKLPKAQYVKISALGKAGDKGELKSLLKWLYNPDGEARRLAALALGHLVDEGAVGPGRLCDVGAIDALYTAMDDPNLLVKQAAEWALKALARASSRAALRAQEETT